MMALIREKLGLNWTRWALITRPEGGICARCGWPIFQRRWHNTNKTVQTQCTNCGLLHSAHPDIRERKDD